MRSLRGLFAGMVVVVAFLSPAAFLSGCGDDANKTGTQVQESEESKQANASQRDAMKNMMLQKSAPKPAAK